MRLFVSLFGHSAGEVVSSGIMDSNDEVELVSVKDDEDSGWSRSDLEEDLTADVDLKHGEELVACMDQWESER